MIEQTLVTRLKQKMATLAEWKTVWETFIPLHGEQCIIVIPANSDDGEALGFTKSDNVRHVSKTGDGTSAIGSLPWDADILNIFQTLRAHESETNRIAALVGEDSVSNQIISAFGQRFFVGTTEEYNTAHDQDLIAVGTIVLLTDDDIGSAEPTSSILGRGVLGQMILS